MNPVKKSEQDLSILRHSAAHLLAHAISELFPKTQLTIGPATKDGFFYDCLPEQNFKEDDLPMLEARMRILSEKNIPITHTNISKQKARELYKNNPFKLELIDGIPGDEVGLAQQGDFYDLCKGGHVASTGDIKYFKLESISGSYWRAERTNQALQRISGTAFFTQQELDAYVQHKEDLLKYDHRRIGKQLDLFSFHDESPGSVFFHNKGMIIRNIMIDHKRNLLREAGHQEILTPVMLNADLWKRSGHYTHYKNNMYICSIEDEEFAVKPMNCPGAILVYDERPRSYRELPLRLAEFGLDHRYELSGVLHGLMRVRSFTMDDEHVFCTMDQVEQEIINFASMAMGVYKRFSFDDITIYITTRPPNSMGKDEDWERATAALKNALNTLKFPYEIKEGEGAFYGPKLEFHIKDSMGRSWQCGTDQVDVIQPENFDLTYVTSSGTKERPVILHRAIYGSLERFLGIVLEHYKGNLPLWLAPVQIKVLTITDAQKEYAHSVVQQLKTAGLRVATDTSSDPIAGQIKTAQLERVPWMLVIGKKEIDNNTVTLRHNDGKQEFGIALQDVITRAVQLVATPQ